MQKGKLLRESAIKMTALDELHEVYSRNNIDYELYKDKFSLKTANSGVDEYGISLSEAAPTLIIKTDENLIAAIIRGDTRISFKKLKELLKIKNIRLATEVEIYNLTGAKIGEVSLINNDTKTLIDEKVLEKKYVYGGCGIEKHTLKIKVIDLIRITKATVADFTSLKQL